MVDVIKKWDNDSFNKCSHSKEDVLEYLNLIYKEDVYLNDIIKVFHKEYKKEIHEKGDNILFSVLLSSLFVVPSGIFLDWHHIAIIISSVFLGITLSLSLHIMHTVKNTYNLNIFEVLLNKYTSIKKTKIKNIKLLFKKHKTLLHTLKFISNKKSISSFFRSFNFTESELEYSQSYCFKDKLLLKFYTSIKKQFNSEDVIEILSNFLINKKENSVTIHFKENLLNLIEKERKINQEQLIYAENSTILNGKKDDVINNINGKLLNSCKKLSYIKSL
jgi:hypothetical protein